MANVIAALAILLVLLLRQQAAPSAHADPAPQAGQPCDGPSRAAYTGNDQWLFCAVERGTGGTFTKWAAAPFPSRPDVVFLFSPCPVPGNVAVGINHDTSGATWLALCDQVGDGARVGNVTRWMPYHQ
jgi:hypothetical protein